MGWCIVQQPNGMLARFSDIVDHFTAYDMSYDEAVVECCNYVGRLDAPKKVQSGIDAGNERFEESLTTIMYVHGQSEADKYRALLSEALRKLDTQHAGEAGK